MDTMSKNENINTTLKTTDFILYLLNKMELAKVGKIRLNKLAFFVEFGYIFKTKKPLSETQFAGIDLGPVINDYRKILQSMEQNGDIKIDGNRIIPLKMSSVEIPDEVKTVIDPLIEKFSAQTDRMLVGLSHLTDSYKITTNNEKLMGKIIDKDLALLESFYDDAPTTDELDQSKLPWVDTNRLVPYEFG